MLFNILSCILFLIISVMGFYILFNWSNPRDSETVKVSWITGIIFLIVFMWIMSWQNWWR